MVSLLDGIYDGDFYMSEAKEHGDFGIGTFNRLDGELIGFDGEFYRLRSDGKAYPAENRKPPSPETDTTFCPGLTSVAAIAHGKATPSVCMPLEISSPCGR